MMFSVKTHPQSPTVLTLPGECFYFVYKFSISCFVAVLRFISLTNWSTPESNLLVVHN